MSTHLTARTLSSYLDDMLSKSERTQADLHLQNCAECRALLADLQGIGKMFRDLPSLAPPELQVPAKAERPAKRPQAPVQAATAKRPFRRFRTALSAAAVLLALGLGTMAYVSLSAPTVVYASQPDGAKHVATAAGTSITLQFSEPMSRDSVESALNVKPDTAVVFVWQDDSKRLQLRFPAGLHPNESYTISLADTAKDKRGFPLKEPFAIHFDTFEQVAPQQPAQDAQLVKTVPLDKWTPETARPVQEQVNNGSLAGRLSADHAAMDDLYTGGLLTPQEYAPPVLLEAGSTKALVRFDRLDGGGCVVATVEKLAQQDQNGAWFTTQLAYYE